MTLELFYINGINRTDTLYFENISAQERWFGFNNSRVVVDNFTFYPPHYNNILTLTTEDIDFNSKINYLRFDYNNKWYYYFIDSIEYVSEDTIRIHITLDTIQTYMFDINFINADIERRTIDRWNGDKINRKYLRENLSKGEFYLKDYKELYKNQNYIILDVVSTELINIRPTITGQWYDTLPTFNVKDIYNKDKLIQDGYFHNFIIFPLKKYSITYNGQRISIGGSLETHSETLSYNSIMAQINYISKLPSVISINVIPNYCFNSSDLYIVVSNDNIRVDISGSLAFVISLLSEPEQGQLSYITISPITEYYRSLQDSVKPTELKIFNTTYNFTFIKNTERKKSFGYLYVPQLLDENYINIDYGEKISTTSFPLHELTDIKPLQLYGSYIINNGNRSYWIDIDSNFNDKYNTCKIVPTTESIAVKNDAWQTYLSQNKATLSTGLGYKFFSNATNIVEDVLSIKKPMQMFNSLFKEPSLSADGIDYMRKIGYKTSKGLSGYADTLADYKITKSNLKYTPDTITQGNNIIDNLTIGSNDIIIRRHEVRDIDKAGEQLEEYGYRVNEHYSMINIFTELNTRYYYNYLQFGEVNISLNLINDNDTISLIIERLQNGIRLWNTTECENDNLQIGELFKYDNVERSLLV